MEMDFSFLVRIILEVVQLKGVIHRIMGGGKGNGRLWFSNSVIFVVLGFWILGMGL